MTDNTLTRISSKRELAAWLKEHAIPVVRVYQKRGALYFQPVLPAKVEGAGTSHKVSIGLSRNPGLMTNKGWYHSGEKYVKVEGKSFLQPVLLTPEEMVIQDAYVARLNEIESMVFEIPGVYMVTHAA